MPMSSERCLNIRAARTPSATMHLVKGFLKVAFAQFLTHGAVSSVRRGGRDVDHQPCRSSGHVCALQVAARRGNLP